MKTHGLSAVDAFENTMANREIARHEQFLLLRKCIQLYSIIILSISFLIFALMFSNLSAADLVDAGNGYQLNTTFVYHNSNKFI